MRLTDVDASVLIAAAQGRSEQAQRAFGILDDPTREFAASDYLKLEVLPKAVYEHRAEERAFYETFFKRVARWAPVGASLVDAAFEVATEHGLAAMDALHIAAAESLGVAEFVTGETPTKPVFRVPDMKIRSIHG